MIYLIHNKENLPNNFCKKWKITSIMIYISMCTSLALVLFGVWFQIMWSILVNAMDIPDNTHGTSLSFAQAIIKLNGLIFKFK